MSIDRALAEIEAARWYRGQICHSETLPASPSRHAQVSVHPALQAELGARGLALYTHQVEAIEAFRAGSDVALATPTASGKTLAFNLPILETLIDDPDACALYLYPLKALANDQLKKIEELIDACPAPIDAETYDGDTPATQKARIRRTARIVLSNPHALFHYLPWHHQWQRIFTNLRALVLDEAHQYRGVFGANVAFLLRRVLRIARYYGSDPQIVVSSASIANPDEFARSLTGRSAVAICDDGSEHGEKYVLFWDPMLDPTRSVTTQAARLLATLTKCGVQTICFARSRVGAEVIAQSAARTRGVGIAPYRAGYLASDRRAIEADLRSGEIRGVVSTTALESGIDIGGLDAAILVGFPGSLLSAWQQAGRAGRGDAPSLLIFMAGENPLDRFFLRHPEVFLGTTRERLAVPLANSRLRAGHMLCAAAELPLRAEEVTPEDEPLVRGMTQSGLLFETPRGFVYRGLRRAHEMISLDEPIGETIRLMQNGALIETMDPVRARRDAYPGAILLHRGETLLVERLDLELGIAETTRVDADYHTQALRSFEVEILSTGRTRSTGTWTLHTGRVRVTDSTLGYKAFHADQVISMHPVDLPPHTYETDALWISLDDSSDVPVAPGQILAALHGAEHALLAMAPLLVLCDASDMAGLSTPIHPQTAKPTVLLFDQATDGAGLAPSLFPSFDTLLRRAFDLVRDCPCESGCPSCLLSPRCGSQNEPLSKDGARAILEHLLQSADAEGGDE